MGTSAEKPLPPVTDSGIVVGEESRRPGRRVWSALVLGLCLIGIAVAVVVIFHRSDGSKTTPIIVQKPLQYQTIIQDATTLASNNQYATAQQTLKDALTQTKDKTALDALYSAQVTLAINAQDYPGATSYAQAYENALASSTSAALLADLAAHNGDKTTAKKYYNLAISRLDTNTDGYDYIIQNYQKQLRQVSQ